MLYKRALVVGWAFSGLLCYVSVRASKLRKIQLSETDYTVVQLSLFWKQYPELERKMAQSQIRQNFHVENEASLNKQINMELQASYTYQSMVSLQMPFQNHNMRLIDA